MSEETERPRRVNAPLMLVLLVTMVLGGMAAYQATMSTPRPVASPIEARPGPNDLTVVAGMRVDVVTLGLPVREVEQRWGKALIRPTEDGLIYNFEQMAISVMARDERVVSIMVKNQAFRTKGGASVNGDVDFVMREFGTEFDYEKMKEPTYRVHYWDKGIAFTVEKNLITSIQVSEPVFDR